LYLSLVARENYFVPSEGFMEVGIKTFQPRLFILYVSLLLGDRSRSCCIRDVTVHILTGVLVVFAALGVVIHVLHYRMRDLVILPHRPGTLASAAFYTARSDVGDVLDGYLDEAALERVLKNKRFRTDKSTGRIVMEGEEGFETGDAVPPNRRKSMLNKLKDIRSH
jgi:hypothetical protein